MKRGIERQRSRPKGFTLIEIMIAVAIIAISFLAFYRLLSQTIAADEVSRFYTMAPMLAQGKMAEITGGVSPAMDGSGSFEAYPGYTWQVIVRDVSSKILGQDAVSGMKQVNVTISLGGSSRQYGLRAYAFLRQ